MGPRGQIDLVGHRLIRYTDFTPGSILSANNWIVAPSDPANEWMRSLMQLIGEWRAILRSTYIRWAIAINGLHVAAERYRNNADPTRAFQVRSVRSDKTGSAHESAIAQFNFQEAADAHLKAQPMLCAHGFIDLYAGLEEMIFAFYRTFLSSNPELILRGDEFREHRRARRDAGKGPTEEQKWEALWTARLDAWQRKKLYDGLGRVFLAFCNHAGIKTPAGYTVTTVETWAESIEGVSLLRNALIHGLTIVPDELTAFCAKPHSLGFRFEKGDPLRLELLDLQVLEAFCDQLLTALNLSLVELASPEVRDYVTQHLEKEVTKGADGVHPAGAPDNRHVEGDGESGSLP